MKYVKQFAIILAATCAGEILKSLIGLPVPGSICGLVILLLLLIFRVIRPEQVRETGEFLIEIMSVMFIPVAVGLIASWDQVRGMLLPLCVIVPVSTVLVFGVTGKVTDLMLGRGSK